MVDKYGLFELYVFLIFVGLANLLLWFKVWAMTNNVKLILDFMLMKDGYEVGNIADRRLYKKQFVKKKD